MVRPDSLNWDSTNIHQVAVHTGWRSILVLCLSHRNVLKNRIYLRKEFSIADFQKKKKYFQCNN